MELAFCKMLQASTIIRKTENHIYFVFEVKRSRCKIDVNISIAQMPFRSSIARLLFTYLALTILILQQLWYYTFLTVFIGHPVNFPCGRKLDHPRENPRLSAERWLTLFTWVRSENPTIWFNTFSYESVWSVYYVADIPTLLSWAAAARPAGPLPIIATVLFVLIWGG
jgi:hypothetical protein